MAVRRQTDKPGRQGVFRRFNTERTHQQRAGLASWEAFSARWRARQGLPLLSPLHVQYLTPHDFCNGLGHPLPAAEQRRWFRHYICLALGESSPLLGSVQHAMAAPAVSAWEQEGLWDAADGVARDDLAPYERGG